ncbi:hypothetical protein TRFO_19045 [Tritrichomonas foetus]|uniref:IFT81 calponin homology domain-containing protein n=1 Tax=Tritrichomonas foetus TaxID=1144522 RepID=A0A1J4KP71_9EUKA|nr:hypothetical protein TRFO_19045 [Tritrichomonas foetus]|eukprot:OHT11502.1 hypothetical protein TRFO_19045 [Tritrichomonas foetus]
MSSTQGNPKDLIEQIVLLLKKHLNLSFTLFQFSEISDQELLELFNTVIHAISDEQPEKIGTEKIEATVDRVSEFLRVLKYEFPVEPEEWDVRLTNADKDLIHPAIYFLLNDFEEMKKRSYKAKYSEEVPIPDEIKVDSTVSELLTQHLELRERFDEVLLELEEIGGTNVDELKKTMADLESDKARLATRIGGFKRKLAKVSNLDELLKWTSKLRLESEKEMKLNDELQRLNEDKRLLMHRQQAADDQIKNMKGTLQKKLAALQEEYDSMRNQGNNASADEKGLIAKQQQVLAATKRLDMKKKQLADLQKQHSEAEERLKEMQSQDSIEVPSPTQFAAYVRNLKAKNENYKQLQSTLAAQKKELAVMMRTEEIVTQQHEKVKHEISRIERERGVGGFREAREQLEKVSATKADLDDMKGQTLEEMSQISKEIQRSIQARQNELKPLVSKLQEQRKLKAGVESKYLQMKQRYQNAVSEYDSVCMELDEESKKLRGDIATYQSKLHYTSHLLQNLERTLRRAREEQNAIETGNPISKTIKTYSDYFQKSSHALKKETRALKEQKKSIGNQTEANQKQLEMFQSLRRLLQVKLECQKKAKKQKEEELKQDDIERMNPDEIITID